MISFLIIAFVVLVKGVNNAKTAAEGAKEPEGPTQGELLVEIRNLLVKA